MTTSLSPRSPLWHAVLYNALLTLVYVMTAKLGLLYGVVHGNATLLWIPTGLSLAAVLLGGYRLLPGVAIGAFLTVASTPVPKWVALSVSVGNTLEAFLGAFLLRRLPHFDLSLQRVRDVWNLLLWAAVVSTVASATIGVSSLCASGAASWAQFPKIWLLWWLGNLMSNVVVAPILLVWSQPPRWQVSQLLEFAVVVLLTSLLTLVAFGGWIVSSSVQPYPLAFIVFPALIWAAQRFELHGSTAAIVAVAGFSTWMTLSERGPFANFALQESLALLWVFIGLTTVTALTIASSASERRHAEESLQQAYAQIYQIINNAPGVAIQGYDQEGRVVFWNRASEQLYGFQEQQVLGKRLGEFLLSERDAREFERLIQEVARTGQPAPLREWETHTASGTLRYIISSLFPVQMGRGQMQIVCMDVDITERKQLEAQLLRAQRLESIGRLAGGIAHDFNNLLTAIASYAETALARQPPGHPAIEEIQRLLDTVDRAAELVHHLLAFARQQSLKPQPLNLNQLLQRTVPLLHRLLGKQVDLRLITDPALREVRADPTQMEQVLLNLVINARDAMPSGGLLTVETANVTLDAEATQAMPDLSPGEYVMLSVSDTGTGILPEHLDRIFEPFFTTKGETGTGLGLAVVYGVVKQSGGHVTVESAPGRGTTFRIYLPAFAGTED
ncbi:MAG: MASE1 domain-containing protein [Armatimonadetes bacterium]|nr:MASE1 domain-containing protein [Armatimonadota bacterium]